MTPHELFEAIERMTLEEQNRDLLRARAVSQVVRQVFLMERSADLAKAIRVMQDELSGLAWCSHYARSRSSMKRRIHYESTATRQSL